jgi:hypothetical protein
MAAKEAGSDNKHKKGKHKKGNGGSGKHKTDPDLVEAASLEVEAIESSAGIADDLRADKAVRVPARRSRRGLAPDGTSGPDEGQGQPTRADADGEQVADGRGPAGAAADGVLARVAAVGEYGAALTEFGRNGLAKAGTAVRQGATAVGQVATDGVARGRDVVARGWEEYPLAFCAAALAAGVAAGLLLPSTKVEDDLMGKAADAVNGRIRRAATGLADTSRGVAEKALDEVRAVTAAATGDEGLTPQAIGQKVKRVAGRVKAAVAGAVEVS